MSRAVLGLALLLSWLLAHQVQAQPLTDPALQRGATWLQAQVQAGGTLASEATSPALPMQARAETALTLRTLSQTVRPALFTAIDGITPDTTEYLARKALARQLAGTSDAAALDALATMQNPDGGFGAIGGQASNPQDTAWALRALAANRAASDTAAKALNGLVAAQQPDGRWLQAPDGDAIVTTALAVQALAPYRQQPAARAALTKARAWLLAQRNAQQTWGEDLRTAHALLAVLPGLTSATDVQGAVATLGASQRADGSWSGDAHLTALVLRALLLAAQPVTNPDMASVTGMLLDSQSRAPLAGFTVSLRGTASLSATTSTTGEFEFTALAAGPYTLEVATQGEFRALLADINLMPGQRLEVGQLLLNRNANPTTATVLGKVTRSDTGAAISGAVIKVGTLTTPSGADGSYQFLEVPPGDVTVSVSHPGFRGAAGQVTLQAGSTAIFSPVLVPVPAGGVVSGAVSGVVLNALNGQPIAGATITVSGAFIATTQTEADGKYTIAPLPSAGQITLAITAAGYQSVTASAVVQTDSLIDFSPQLVPQGGTAGTGKIHGVVLDAGTGTPLAGVQVSAVSATTRSATTDATGSYLIVDVPPGVVRVIASKSGYASAAAEALMVANGLMEFSPQLTKATTTTPTTSAVFGTVVSARDGQPVAAAEVYVSGLQSYSVSTDVSGRYRVDGLAAGNYSVTISHPEHTSASVNFNLPARTEMDFSPVLNETSGTPVIIPNSATVSGRVLDSTTNRPIDGAVYQVDGESRERGVNRFGRFNILGITAATVNVTFSAPGYHPVAARFPVTPLAQQDVGDVYMERVVAARLPDLAVARFDVSGLSSNPVTAIVWGAILAEVVNQGAQDTPATISLLVFEDLDRNGRFDAGQDVAVARAEISGGLMVGQSKAVTIAVNAALRYRDAPLTLWVDSDQLVIELDEDNNIDRYGSSPEHAAKLYASAAEFNEGQRINVAVNAAGNALQLADNTRAFDNIWIANSGRGTVLKVDIRTGAVLGEYRSAPDGMGKNPSRTTVDKNGNVWVGNRNEGGYVNANAIEPGLPATARGMGSVVKIGLLDNGQCVDRNGNGVIDTSTGLGDVKDWKNTAQADSVGGISTAEDECILAYTRVNATGTRHISVDRKNQVWVSGTGGRHFDLVSETGNIVRQEVSVGWGGYGGLIDANDVIWSSTGGNLLRWDTQNPLTGPNGGNWLGIGRASYGLCIDSRGNVWDSRGSVYRPDGTLLRTFRGGSQGCAVDDQDHVWVASGSNVAHYTNDGVFIGNVYTGATGGTTGLSTDANGKVWAVGGSRYVRIDPAAGPLGADGVTRIGAIDVTGPDLGSGSYLYNYSDMTGSTLSGKPREGTWTAVYDSGATGTLWGMLDWHAQVLGDGKLSVTVASSDDCNQFSAPAIAASGQAFAQVPPGRCLKVSVHFKRASTGESPVLYDLKIRPAVPDFTASRIQTVDAGGGQVGLQALIGNASPFDAGPFDVAFWQGQPSAGGVLLGTVSVSGLAADSATPVQLLGLQVKQALGGDVQALKLGVGDEIVVHADSADAYVEYNERNNWASAPLGDRNMLAALQVQTDQPAYPAHASVGFGAGATNLGSFDALFDIELLVQDSEGREVARFPRTALGSVAAGATFNHGQPWNTGATVAGTYLLRGLLYDTAGNVVAEASTLFAITPGAGNPGAPLAALTVATNKGVYARDDVVLLDTLARNLSLNAPIDGAQVVLQVLDSLGQTVFSFQHAASPLAGNGLLDQRAQQTLRGVQPGSYTVQAQLLNVQGHTLAQANTRYVVIDGQSPGTAPGLSVAGTTTVSAKLLRAGDAQARHDAVVHTGTSALQNLRIIRIVAAEDGREIQRLESTIHLAPGATHRFAATSVPTHGMAAGRHFALMMGEVNGQLILLAQDEFRVDGVVAQPRLTPVPTLSPFALAVLAAGLAVSVGAFRKKARSVRPPRGFAPHFQNNSQAEEVA
ncbi:MAG: carboxypeptidase regulatory-like domain-containing protein [Pseudomonadota bacterium]|nr:carboxypeptidase regulatory-like domain-containing protein [Pseudomonadota bacterium]